MATVNAVCVSVIESDELIVLDRHRIWKWNLADRKIASCITANIETDVLPTIHVVSGIAYLLKRYESSCFAVGLETGEGKFQYCFEKGEKNAWELKSQRWRKINRA